MNEGNLVTIHSVLTLDDGTVVNDTYETNTPVRFVCADGNMVPGVLEAVRTMNVGETRELVLEPEDAFGVYDESKINYSPADFVPNYEKLPIGEYIYFQDKSEMYPVKVVGVERNMVIFDENHPLAGKRIHWKVELISSVAMKAPGQK